TYFDGAKVGKPPRSGFRPDFVGFLRPVTDPGVAATRHPWRGAASLASCQATPDQRQDSAVTNVALCVVSDIAVEKRFCASGCA
ncbi:hypothetical protein, partial [Pseudomonas syringae]|uniref:hypothetical protein n=1 Tax=Pseudomonas syringae TaxID=317 RepID=UPI003208279D